MAKQKEPSESKGKFQDTLDNLNTRYGKGSIMLMDSKDEDEYETFSTGSISFDHLALGIGGFAKGKVYELMGWEGTGKTTICAHAVAECQKAGGTVLYIDGEHAVDKNYIRAIGVDTTKLVIAQPSCGEEGFNIAMDMIKSGTIDLVIIDSDSSLIPKKVLEGEIGDSAIGKKAMLNSNAYPKLKALADIYKTCIIIVSQYREKIGVMFGNPTTTQGGHALKFYTDCRLEISRSIAKDGDVAYGITSKIKATKNKMFPPYRTCEFDIVFGEGIDIYAEIVSLGTNLGIIQKSGSWYSYGETKLGQGSIGVKEILIDNPELYEEIREKIIAEIKRINKASETTLS